MLARPHVRVGPPPGGPTIDRRVGRVETAAMTGRGTRAGRWLGLACAVVVVAAGCGWPTLGGDAARSGTNPYERTLTLGNVAQLQQSWSADAPGTSPPAVDAARVYVVGPGLRAYSADGTAGCAGSPRV